MTDEKFNLDTVQYGSALLDDTQHVVSIANLNKVESNSHLFRCPHCGEKMYPTFGPKNVPHFRHIGQKCQYSSYLHDLAKSIFKEEFERCLRDKIPFILELHTPTKCDCDCLAKGKKECKRFDSIIVDLAKLYTSIILEQRILFDDHARRPDILLKSDDGQQLWIEIWVTHETELNKRKEGQIVELKINSEKDLIQFRNHHITQSEDNDLAVRTFNVEYDDITDAVQIKRHNSQNCCDYVARPSISKESLTHSYSIHKETPNYYKKTTSTVKPVLQELVVQSPESREWIDLGLPSGTLWAKMDVATQITFNSAISRYNVNVPSIIQAEELKACCSREWDKETKTIKIKGPNGNCIFFHCSNDDTPFWLNTCERDIRGKQIYFGHCYHLGNDNRFDINDKEEHSLIGLHLVKKE